MIQFPKFNSLEKLSDIFGVEKVKKNKKIKQKIVNKIIR